MNIINTRDQATIFLHLNDWLTQLSHNIREINYKIINISVKNNKAVCNFYIIFTKNFFTS